MRRHTPESLIESVLRSATSDEIARELVRRAEECATTAANAHTSCAETAAELRVAVRATAIASRRAAELAIAAINLLPANHPICHDALQSSTAARVIAERCAAMLRDVERTGGDA